jgi:hypothetical protein
MFIYLLYFDTLYGFDFHTDNEEDIFSDLHNLYILVDFLSIKFMKEYLDSIMLVPEY